jgi:hypothetical protein
LIKLGPLLAFVRLSLQTIQQRKNDVIQQPGEIFWYRIYQDNHVHGTVAQKLKPRLADEAEKKLREEMAYQNLLDVK